jgi:hypothetical protein
MTIIQNFGDVAGLAGDAYGGGGGGGGGGLSSSSLGVQVNSNQVGTVLAPSASTTSTGASSVVNALNSQFPTTATEQVNLQILPEGFGSYLENILPSDIAAAAGAFSATMQQIKNVRKLEIEKFAQVVASLETTAGLNLVNGTNVPTDTTEAKAALALIALGSGPYGTYTYSDFFGCMSGLPYPWKDIQPAIIGLQTTALSTIYQNLYLALTWEQATATVTPGYSTSAIPDGFGNYNYFYTIQSIQGIASFNGGGGYGRDGAATPTATIDGGSGATLILTIDTKPVVNNGSTTFGKVLSGLLGDPGISVSYGSGASATPPPPPATLNVTIQAPPALTPDLDTVVQAYIDAANAQIAIIETTHPGQSMELNDMWDNLGTQLTIEQKARNLGLTKIPPPNVPPAEVDREDLFQYPIMIYSFTDSVPVYSKQTQPNMAAQTLEAISDLTKVAGESIVGMMRSERNQARLIEAGILLDDNIPDSLSAAEATELTANGTVANSAPAFPFNVAPAGYYEPATENFLVTVADPNTAVTNPPATKIEPQILGAPNSSVAAVLGIGTIDGLPVPSPDIGIGTEGISQVSIPDATPFFAGPGAGGGEGSQGGGPIVPGSLAGSPYTQLIPPALNPIYTSGSLLPASLSVAQAIEQVITCNCDCWVQ